MKKFTASVQYVTIKNGSVVDINESPVIVYARDRTEVIHKACDVGQAIARAANNSNVNIFFRIVDITEIGAV